MQRWLGVVIPFVMVTTMWGPARQDSGVNPARLAHLERGVSLFGWFWGGPESLDEIESTFVAADFALIHDMGFQHVRLPVGMAFLYDAASPDLLNPDRLAALDRALALIRAYDLAVIVDLHNADLPGMGTLEDDAAFGDLFIMFWRSLAAHLSTTTDPEWVFLEPLNEPVFEQDPERWEAFQARLLAAIREQAPDHTLIATSARWSKIETLIAMTPLDDPNIVYSFHFYEPTTFTHQGATWSIPVLAFLQTVPYPSSPTAIQIALSKVDDPAARELLEQYGAEEWNADTLAALIAPAVEWANANHVPLICDEFGAYQTYAIKDDRARWLYDVRTLFEQNGIGWTMWEYDGSFGLMQHSDNKIYADGKIAEALGLEALSRVVG